MDEDGRFRVTEEQMVVPAAPGPGVERKAVLRRHELSVVRSDLRGFTAFCEVNGADAAVELLRDYYATVAAEVMAFGASIKEHAGDGTLVLVGAIEPSSDHAERAVAMSLSIMVRAEEFLAPHRGAGTVTGLGIGVASGVVSVGSVEAGTRVEPVAVGAAVNLAARLCARAGPGQILVDFRTLQLVRGGGSPRFEALEQARLKGFARPVPIFQAIRA